MFNLTKDEASKIQNLLTNNDFLMYQKMLLSLRDDAEKRTWSNPNNATEAIIERNTIEMIINMPRVQVDRTIEDIEMKRISDTASL